MFCNAKFDLFDNAFGECGVWWGGFCFFKAVERAVWGNVRGRDVPNNSRVNAGCYAESWVYDGKERNGGKREDG